MIFLYQALNEVQDFALLGYRTMTGLLRKPRYLDDLVMQMDIIGTGSILIVMLTGFFTGGVMALQSAKALKAFGAVNLTGQLVSLSLVRVR